ncbi:hypothetical protein M758_3G019700 [Ceratodon purpureus]|nr:hypothetical protein M758_3G019700 [Ceratodon purpureus]
MRAPLDCVGYASLIEVGPMNSPWNFRNIIQLMLCAHSVLRRHTDHESPTFGRSCCSEHLIWRNRTSFELPVGPESRSSRGSVILLVCWIDNPRLFSPLANDCDGWSIRSARDTPHMRS